MRAVALAVILVAGCTASPGPTSSAVVPGAAVSSAPTATPSAPPSPTPSAPPTPSPTVAPSLSTSFTADDEAIARLIRTAADEAIPDIKVLNVSDPSKLEELFLPLGAWIASQKAGLEPYTASNCTADAVARFMEGLDRYDAIRKKFLAWRDWGAIGNAFPPGAPREAADSFRKALVELDARCKA